MRLKVDIKKPNIVLLDISGTIATKAFMTYSSESKDFVKKNIKEFIGECYPKKKELRLAFNFMKLQEVQDRGKKDNAPKLADNNAPRDKRGESMIKWILHKLDTDPEAYSIPAISLFQLHMIEWGYAKGLLSTPVYEDVVEVLTRWTQTDKLLLYVTLSSDKFADVVLSKTTAGNLKPFFHSNVSLMEFKDGKLTKTFEKIAAKLKVEAHNILFLTRIAEDARHAKELGYQCVLVVRKDFEPHLENKILEAKKVKESYKADKSSSLSSFSSSISSRKSSSLSIALGVLSTSSSLGEVASTEDMISVEGLTTSSTIDAIDLADFSVVSSLKDIHFK